MLENDQIQTGPTQYSTDNSDKASSHKKSSHNKRYAAHYEERQSHNGSVLSLLEKFHAEPVNVVLLSYVLTFLYH